MTLEEHHIRGNKQKYSNNKADNTQRQKHGLDGKRVQQRRVWKSAVAGLKA
ncbi:uncharacterized protein Dana_GF27138 [Drosophila ananassae]|uniref:Uncharacterized protein n=1 Tax=Drosophila ananassae TaxID=7217 RepID=A0A0P8XTR5_DROAN|nr:uncharacterized protein Dana_GF27138 [Drosophila ananassae]